MLKFTNLSETPPNGLLRQVAPTFFPYLLIRFCAGWLFPGAKTCFL